MRRTSYRLARSFPQLPAHIAARAAFCPRIVRLAKHLQSFRQAHPFEEPLPKRVVGSGSADQCPFGRCLQVSKKLLQQRAVIRAKLAILTEYNSSVCVRGRELKVAMMEQERVCSSAHVSTG
jgi:hypothetical protein